MKKIITISRQFGSGGRSIGKAVAEELGYTYYDKDLIEKISDETGLSKKYIEENGEATDEMQSFSHHSFLGRSISAVPIDDFLWQKQRKVIIDLAEEGNCVIVGRCGNYILRDRDDVLNVFIHAPLEARIRRVVERYGETDVKPEKRVKEKDKKRKANYEYNTRQKWGMATNYHLTLDTAQLGTKRCESIIVDLAREL